MACESLDGRWVRVNDALCALLQYREEELLNGEAREFTHPDDRAREVEWRGRLLDAWRDRVQYDKRLVRRDGSVVPVRATTIVIRDGRDAPESLLSVMEDCSALRLAQEALQAERSRVAFALEAARAGVWEVDLRQRRLRASESLAAVHGMTLAEFPAGIDAYLSLVHADDRAVFTGAIELAGAGAGQQFHHEYRVVWPDRTIHWLEVVGRLLDQGVVRGVATDMTARRELELRLEQAQKLEAIGRFASGIAHDFSNVLSAIIGYTDVILSQVGDREPMRADVLEVQAASERAVALTRQLLAFGRRQTWQPRILDVNLAVSRLAGLLTGLLRQDIGLHVALDPLVGSIRIDPGQFEQVLMNLVINARDAMPAGGSLRIETATRGSGLERSVCIRVQDSGIGIEPAHAARIFDPFFTTKGNEGTGLGLSTVRDIVERTGGRIAVSSQPLRGTEFEICFPGVAGPAETDAATQEGRDVGQPVRSVLIVDDDEPVRKLLKRLLAPHGLDIAEAGTAARALALAAQRQSAIDLLITDVVMPHASGLELAANLRAICPDAPVIFMTGQVDSPQVRELMERQEAILLQKPFTATQLYDAIRTVEARPRTESAERGRGD